MKKLDLFILKSFFGPFVMTFFITVFILVMQFLWLYIDELVGKGLSFWVIMEFLGWGSATILPLSMPLATLLASIMTFGNLGENNELLAMKAAGISLQRIFLPLIFVAFAISVAAFFVSNNLIPLAYNKIYTLQYDIARTKDEIKIPTGTFYNGIDGYSLRVNSSNKETGMMYDVMIYNHTKNKGNISLAVADSGMIRSTPDKKALVFTLYHGVSYEEDNTRTARDTSYVLQQVDFEMQEIVIALENYAFQKSEDTRYGNEIMSKNLQQLRVDRDSLGHLHDSTATLQRKEVVYDLSMRSAKQLDTAKNKEWDNAAVFPLDTLGWTDTQREIKAVEDAIKSVQKAIQTMNDYHREVNQYAYYLRRIDLEYLRKFTLSFACFIFFFIGAPLGAIIRKGGLGTPVIVSALFFVMYWVVDISGKKLARDGVISPELGAFISTLVLLPIGVFLTWKSTKDSSIFNMETYILPVKKFFVKMFGSKKKRTTGTTDGTLSRGRRTGIVFMGTPDFAVESLKALVEGGYNVMGVVTVPDRKTGRGQKISCSPVKQYAMEHSLPLLQPESLKDPDFLKALKEFGADMFVVVAFRMLPRDVWSMPPMGTFNLHASLLPAYRGAAPINWAVINGETRTGVTTFLLDEHMDTGAVLFQEEEEIQPEDNAGMLYDRLKVKGAGLVLKTVDALVEGSAKPRPQDVPSTTSQTMSAPKLSRQTGAVDWTLSAERIHNLVRGLAPRPGAHCMLRLGEQDVELKIYRTELAGGENFPEDFLNSCAGTVYTDHKSILAVRCGDGVLSIKELQAPGKKTMPVASFLAGWRG